MTVEGYPAAEQRDKPEPPFVWVRMLEASPGTDPGTDQLALVMRWEAHCGVTGMPSDPEAPVQEPSRIVRNLAVAVAQIVHRSRWGLTVSPAEIVVIAPDEGSLSETDEYEVFRVEWEQEAHIGASSWAPPEGWAPPDMVLTGVSPDIGPPHIDDYRVVYPDLSMDAE